MTDLEQTPPGPPPEQFWSRYNRRFEFPISAAAAVLLHSGVAALLLIVLVQLMGSSPSRGAVPIELVPELGLDDDGSGRPGGGGFPDPLVEKDASPWTASLALLPDPAKLPDVTQSIRKLIDDEAGAIPISPANAPQYQELDEVLRKKLLQNPGAKKGAGTEPGRGDTGEKGSGPGGDKNDDSRARSLRWVLRFSTESGRDYVDQLAALKAQILIPIPPENKETLIVPDLKERKKHRPGTDADLKQLAGKVKFSDARKDSVESVCAELGIEVKPRTFWAFFPKEVEDELLKKEKAYRNRLPENIEETVFRVRWKDGKIDLIVEDQRVKN